MDSPQLKTRCPNCRTTFKINQRHLQVATGMVRCGKCSKAFNAKENLLRLNSPATETPSQKQQDAFDWRDEDDFVIDDNFDLTKIGLENEVDSTQENKHQLGDGLAPHHGIEALDSSEFTSGSPINASEKLEEIDLDEGAMSDWKTDAQVLIAAQEPASSDTPKPTGKTGGWLLGSILAALTLALQVVYFNSLSVPRGSTFWPVTSTICPLIGCPLPPLVDKEQILSTDLVIRSHPSEADSLLVDAVIVNNASFNQPFPPLTLSFESLQGVIVAQRTFKPDEYLYGELSGLNQMPSRKPVKLEMEIIDPGKDAVSFRLFVAR